MRFIKVAVATLLLLIAATAFGAGNITVISPTEGDVLGATNNLSFSITGAVTQVTVTAVLTGNDGNTTGTTLQFSQVFTNIVNNTINGTVAMNLAKSNPEGSYVLTVTATENNNTYNTPTPIDVSVVLTPPKFVEFSPNKGQFVKGIVPITVTVETAHIKDYRVQVNGQDIPNNTGSTTSFVVDWNTTLISTDGPQTILITVRDLANNTATQSINVTLDRLAPVITVQFPRSDTSILPHSKVPFLIDIQDASSGSVDVSGVDVILTTMAGTPFYRVPRISFTATGSNTNRWSGRVRPDVNLPSKFILKVTALDRAGNIAVTQQVNLTTG